MGKKERIPRMTKPCFWVAAFVLLFSLVQTYLLNEENFYQPILISYND